MHVELPPDRDDPEAPPQGRPGVVLIHDAPGLDAHAHDAARRLAAAGFVVAAPDLAEADGADRRVLADLDEAARALGERDEVDAERIAAVGFGAGGTYAFLLGCTSTRVGAVVDFGGGLVYPELSAEKPTQPLELALNLGCPLLGLFGEEDPSVPAEDVERMRAVLSQFSREFDILTYPGAGHGFFDDRRPGHHEAAAQDAWRRTLDFLRTALPPEP